LNPASAQFFSRARVPASDGKAKARSSWLAALVAGGTIFAAFVLSAPFGSSYFSPNPRPPTEATNVYFIDSVA
jgi:hypothetical protein